MPGTLLAQDNKYNDETFVLGMIRPETQIFGKWQRMVYSEVFERLGIEVEFRQLPAARASEYADAGKVDGEPARPSSYYKKHPAMIRIPEPVFAVNFTVFSREMLPVKIESWADLAQLPEYFVEYRRGIHICETNLPKYVDEEHLSAISTTTQGLQKLKAKRSDIFIDEETGVLTLLNTRSFKNSGIRPSGIAASIPAYMYIHKSRADLVDDMTEVVRQLKSEGLIEDYRQQLYYEFGVVATK